MDGTRPMDGMQHGKRQAGTFRWRRGGGGRACGIYERLDGRMEKCGVALQATASAKALRRGERRKTESGGGEMRGRDRSCGRSKVWGGYDFGTDGRLDLESAQAVEALSWKRAGLAGIAAGRAAVRQNRANQAKLRRCEAKFTRAWRDSGRTSLASLRLACLCQAPYFCGVKKK